MRGLDPRSHAEFQKKERATYQQRELDCRIDCRVKPGNDAAEKNSGRTMIRPPSRNTARGVS
jgi:hypothetical protein